MISPNSIRFVIAAVLGLSGLTFANSWSIGIPVAGPELGTAVKAVQAHTQVTVHAYREGGDPASHTRFAVLGASASPSDAPLWEGITDAAGKATLTLPDGALPHSDKKLLGVQIIACEPGKQIRFARAQPRKVGPSGSMIYALPVFDGFTAFGHVISESGPPSRTNVSLQTGEGVPIPTPHQSLPSYQLRRSGWFLVHYSKPLVIQGKASEPGLGTCQFSGIELGALQGGSTFEVRLRGDGVLRGTLVDQAGMPVPDFPLRFHYRHPMGDPASPAPGNVRAQTKTGADGSFVVKGLRPGHYRVRSQGKKFSESLTAAWEDTVLVADGREQQLVFGHSRLELILLDAKGAPWSGPWTSSAGPFPMQRAYGNENLTYKNTARLVVVECGGPEDGNLVVGDRLQASAREGNRVTFSVKQGREYWVGALGGDFPLQFQRVRTVARPGTTRVKVRAAAKVEFGTVDVGLGKYAFDSPAKDGLSDDKVARQTWRHQFIDDAGFWIETVPHGIFVLGETSGPIPTRIQEDLPVGIYRLVAAGRAPFRYCGSSKHRPRSKGYEDRLIEVRSGTTAKEVIELARGARLKISIRSHPEVATPQEPVFDFVWFDQSETAGPFVTIHLESENRRQERVVWYPKTGGPFRSPTGFWPINETKFSERLPYGQYTVVATRCDGAQIRKPVTLKPKETLDLELSF